MATHKPLRRQMHAGPAPSMKLFRAIVLTQREHVTEVSESMVFQGFGNLVEGRQTRKSIWRGVYPARELVSDSAGRENIIAINREGWRISESRVRGL